jgi:hypothetical protein
MPGRRISALVRAGSALTLALVMAACTQGGQFDPTELLSNDVFNTKKKVQGDREPLFPNGVPGAETGVPPDLVKGYQPPVEQAADSGDAAAAAAKPEVKPKPKPKPKPKVAGAAPAKPAPDPAWDRQPGTPAQQPAQAKWPAAPAQTGQPNWPAPPPPSAQAQTNWPGAPQPPQTNWPSPPPPKQTQ